MLFFEVVQKAVEQTPGAVAALLMGSDGIALANYSKPGAGVEMEIIGVECTSLLNEVRKVIDVLESGIVQEVTVSTDKYIIVIRSVTPEYFLALAMSPEGNIGKGRFFLRVSSPEVRKELY